MSAAGNKSRTRNVLSNWAGYLFAAGVNFVLSPFIVHSLGDTSYGIWILLSSLVGYLGLLDLGVRAAVTRFVAKYHTENNDLEASRIVSTALAVFIGMGLLAIAISLGLAYVIVRIVDVPPELNFVTRVVFVLGGINMAVSLVSGVYGGIIVGMQRFDFVNIAEIAIGAIRAIAIVIVLRMGFGLVSLAIVQLSASVLRGFASYLLSRQVYPNLIISLRHCGRAHISLIFSFSSSVLLIHASGMLIFFSDSLVIGSFLPVSLVTFFAIAANLTEYARAPISGISHTLSPWASSMQAKGELTELTEGLVSSARIATLVILPITLTFMLRGESFIALWMGTDYAELSGRVLWILSLALCFSVSNQIVTSVMMGMSKHGKIVPVLLAEGVCNIVLSISLIHSYGIIGVAWGTAIPRLVVALCFAPWYVKHVTGNPIKNFWFSVWCRPLLAMVPFGLATYLVELRWPADNLLLYFAQVGLVFPIAALGTWLFALVPAERLHIRRAIPI